MTYDPSSMARVTTSMGFGTVFFCQECNKYFRYKSLFEQHNRIHTGERPFACTVCEMSFSRKYSLQSHMFTRHMKK